MRSTSASGSTRRSRRFSRFVVPVCLLLALSTSPAAWGATLWYTESPEHAAALQQALQDYWPSAEIEVRLGPRSEGDEGFSVEQGALVLRTAGAERREPVPDDLSLQVALARTWTRDLAGLDMGWVPLEPVPADLWVGLSVGRWW